MESSAGIQRPGIRGGRFYLDDHGRVRYGIRPDGARKLDVDAFRSRAKQFREAARRVEAGIEGRIPHRRPSEPFRREEEAGVAREWRAEAGRLGDAAHSIATRRHVTEGAPVSFANLPPLPHATLDDLQAGNEAGKRAVGAAAVNLIRERVERTPRLGLVWDKVKETAGHVVDHLKEKANIANTVRELAALGKEHGPVFLAYAVAIELFEDVVLPAFLTSIGKPHLIPLALAIHTEPVMYPLYFAVAKFLKGRRAQPILVKAFAAGGALAILTTGHILKAEQLGFSFGAGKPREEVKSPGSRGGKFHATSTGHIAYGDAPTAHAHHQADQAAAVAQQHASTCRHCSSKIIDDEGNPGRFGDACPEGLKHLVNYSRAIGEMVPKWADEKHPAGAKEESREAAGQPKREGPKPGYYLDTKAWRVKHNGPQRTKYDDGVIGYTPSGKVVPALRHGEYDYKRKEFPGWTQQDHRAAAMIHRNHAKYLDRHAEPSLASLHFGAESSHLYREQKVRAKGAPPTRPVPTPKQASPWDAVPERRMVSEGATAEQRSMAETIQAAAAAARRHGPGSEVHKRFMAGDYAAALEAAKRSK